MKRYELSIKPSYLPGWGIFEGVRELVQNARDSETQFDAKMTIEHVYRMRDKRPVGTLVIQNDNITIPRQALLIGYTSKEGRSDLIGKFGEGFKFGILALLRLGLSIKIRNGSETWNPVIVFSKVYDSEVLAFEVSEGNKWENRVQIEILGIDLDTWQGMRSKFLFLDSPEKNVIEVYGGRILTSEDQRGKIYVKGMFVSHNKDLAFGYDFNEADLDRDRRMIDNLFNETSRLLQRACEKKLLLNEVYDMLKLSAVEVDCMNCYSFSDETSQQFVDMFFEEYGNDAVPVSEEDLVTQFGHFGLKAVRVPYRLRTILEGNLGTSSARLAKLKTSSLHVFDLSELTESEGNNYREALSLLQQAAGQSGFYWDKFSFRVVKYADPHIFGTFEYTQNCINISREALSSKALALRVLIHELAHSRGTDGTKDHESAIGALTEATFNILFQRSN